MEDNIFNQEPLFNLTRLEFFNLSMRSDNIEWEKYIEDMLLLRYIYFRYSHTNKNLEMLKYFLHLLEGNFLVFKSDLVLEVIHSLKNKLTHSDPNIFKEYIQIINLSRIIFVYIIQLLYDRNVRLNDAMIQKFLMLDSELDSEEQPDVARRLLKYDFIKKRIDTKHRIDLKKLISEFKQGCIIF